MMEEIVGWRRNETGRERSSKADGVDKTIGFAASMRNGARELSGAVSKKPDR
jgi:hypothetical protein